YARDAERLHIAVDGALGNLQPRRELARREPAVHLEQEHDREEPVGAHSSPTGSANRKSPQIIIPSYRLICGDTRRTRGRERRFYVKMARRRASDRTTCEIP